MLAVALYNQRVQPSEELSVFCGMQFVIWHYIHGKRGPVISNNIPISCDAAYISNPNDVTVSFSPFFYNKVLFH